MLVGDLKGVRRVIIEELKALEDYRLTEGEFASEELLERICAISGAVNREVSLFINRGGAVMAVSLGGLDRVELPDLRVNRSERYIAGVRCLHTHPGGNPQLSAVDINSLITMKLDAMAAVGVHPETGKPTRLCAAFIEVEGDKLRAREYGPYDIGRIPQDLLMERIQESEAALRALSPVEKVAEERERAFLAGIDTGEGEESMEELAGLAETAGAVVVGSELQKRVKPDGGTYLGRGKVEELALSLQALGADLLICDDELTGIQLKNLEEALGVRVIDRTALILDIFAGRARSREGKLQVELAQMRYRLPRLMGMGLELSRQGGGIGTRGPGETRLEADRRRIRRRIFELTEEIEGLKRQRDLRRSRTAQGDLPVVALVGYTNAGKSTLLNCLSGAEAYVANQLFATLDPLTRRAPLAEGQEMLVVDTVGFVNKLPHDLVDAFRSTLEEAVFADLLVHVADGASPRRTMQMKVVEQVLSQLGAHAPRLLVVNKSDDGAYENDGSEGIAISAATGEGIETLRKAIAKTLGLQWREGTWLLSHTEGGLLARIHEMGRVLEQTYIPEGVQVRGVLPVKEFDRLKDKLVESI